MIASQLGFAQGLNLPGLGFEAMVLNLFDPLLYFSLDPAIAAVLTTAPAGATGTASTIAFPIPTTFTSMNLYFQAFQLPTATLSPPLTVHFN